ncbi:MULTISPECIES: CHASE2 domain-containing protein [unclassified Dolichospermum]|uniref:sensor histidine kinase n=1 Tax=unclassified Dolichospermum TaxID=2622029 RepID=UPI001447E6C3|nr:MULTISPECIES: CHASE2 domain-containing protein [unclassified Dolichospermum]
MQQNKNVFLLHFLKSIIENSPLGIFVIVVVCFFRLIGTFQIIELKAFDNFIRMLPTDKKDERIVIVGIDDQDIKNVGKDTMTDQEIANLLIKLQTYHPQVIGLDIYRDVPVEPGHDKLMSVFKQMKNLIVIEKVLTPSVSLPEVTPENFGFSDYFPDPDGKVRRIPIRMKRPDSDDMVYSFSFELAKLYLKSKNITSNENEPGIQLGSTKLRRILDEFGGYSLVPDNYGFQVMVNFHRSPGLEHFDTVSLTDINNGKIEPEMIRDRIVIIGMNADGRKDFVNTEAIVKPRFAGQIYGVEFHAHAVSQIISAVIDGRPLFNSWSRLFEYLWISSWGLLAIILLIHFYQSPLKSIFSISIAGITVSVLGYLLLWNGGWWIPVIPVWLVLGLNYAVYLVYANNNRNLATKINEREKAIKDTFYIIHNGPLQDIAKILRKFNENIEIPANELKDIISKINFDLREISDYLEKESNLKSLRLGNGEKIDLTFPIHDLFLRVFTATLKRNFDCFQSIKIKTRDFDPIDPEYISLEEKQNLCLFLEEALCNVGKHAHGATRISAIGKQENGKYILSIQDNGQGINSSCKKNDGTKLFSQLEKKLGGKFERKFIPPQGTLCELTWELRDKNRNFHQSIVITTKAMIKNVNNYFKEIIKIIFLIR